MSTTASKSADDDELADVEITFTPHERILDELSLSEEEFEEALGKALDDLEDTPDDEEPPALDEVPIVLNGRTYTLGEVCEIEVEGEETVSDEELA